MLNPASSLVGGKLSALTLQQNVILSYQKSRGASRPNFYIAATRIEKHDSYISSDQLDFVLCAVKNEVFACVIIQVPA